MIGGCYTFNDLQAISGLKGRVAVMKWLEKNKVRYIPTSKGATTTHEAINTALGIKPPTEQAANDQYNPGDVL